MAKNNSILEKGPYVHNRAGVFIEIKNFILAEKTGKRYLLLQLVNNFSKTVSAIKFSLVQLDSAGNVITKNSYTYNVKMEPGADFALECGLIIKDECVDFRVQMLYAISGEYKYFFRNGESVQSFDPRGYGSKSVSASDGRSMTVKRRFAGNSALHGLIALVSLILVLGACAFAAIGYFI